MTMTLYVQATSKKAINESLALGSEIYGENYSMFGGGGSYLLNGDLPSGTVIKVFDKYVGGNPYVKAYGMWDGKKVK